MDLYELQHALRKLSTVETPRPPLVRGDKNNETTTRRSRTREVSSRYRSPTPPASSGPRRSPSPTVTRTAASYVSLPKRAISAERKRPSSPNSPPSPSPSTPIQDTSTGMLTGSRKVVGNRMPESLWPSTMRSLSVSFQSDSFSLPINKREKPVTHVLSDRTLRPSSNVAHKQSEITSASRKSTPERMRSPLKGKNSADQSENFRPVESVHSRFVEQHRWPSKTGGKLSTSTTNKGIDLGDKGSRIPLVHSGSGVPSLRRWSLDGMTKPLQKSSSELLALVTSDQGGKQSSVDDNSLELHRPVSSTLLERRKLMNLSVRSQSLSVQGSQPPSPNKASVSSSSVSKPVSSTSLDGRRLMNLTVGSQSLSVHGSQPPSPNRASVSSSSVSKPVSSTLLDGRRLMNFTVRSQSLSVHGSQPPSPNRASASSSSVSRGVSPSRTKTASTVPSRGSSPSRSRPSSPSRQSSNPTSVLSFIADIKKEKMATNHIEDAHQLRLLYNRQLQWRYVNAQADLALQSQQEKAEQTLNSVWRTISDLRDSVIEKRLELQQLMLKLKLYRVLNNQLAYLDEWSTIDEDYADSLSRTIIDLQISTLRLPVTGGARGDNLSVKAAISSAVDVMQAMGSSICYILLQVEETNFLISELADVTSKERAMLGECEALLASIGAMQAMVYSLRTNLIQMNEDWTNQQLIFRN